MKTTSRVKYGLFVWTRHSLSLGGTELVPAVTFTTTAISMSVICFTLLLSTTLISVLTFITVSRHGRQLLLHLLSIKQRQHNQKAIIQKKVHGMEWGKK